MKPGNLGELRPGSAASSFTLLSVPLIRPDRFHRPFADVFKGFRNSQTMAPGCGLAVELPGRVRSSKSPPDCSEAKTALRAPGFSFPCRPAPVRCDGRSGLDALGGRPFQGLAGRGHGQRGRSLAAAWCRRSEQELLSCDRSCRASSRLAGCDQSASPRGDNVDFCLIPSRGRSRSR